MLGILGRRRLLLACVFLAVAACGDESADDPAEFIAQVPVLECKHLARCGVFDSVDHCLAYREQVPPEIGDDLPWPIAFDERTAEAVERGTVTYSSSKARDCLTLLSNRSCSRFSGDRGAFAVCHSAFQGTIAPNEPSAFPFECSSGWWERAICSPDRECCSEPCGPPQPDDVPDRGESCDRLCSWGLICQDGVCVDGARRDEACSESHECRGDLVCHQGRCVTAESLGDTCIDQGSRTLPRHVCNDIASRCTEDLRCRPLVLEGEHCDAKRDLCGRGLRCDLTAGRCVGPGDEGDECVYGWGPMCRRGLYCSSGPGETTAHCRRYGAEGAACEGDYECESHFCNTIDGRCMAPPTCP